MKKKITFLMTLVLAFMFINTTVQAQDCTDLNEYVPVVKEADAPANYLLAGGLGGESQAAQTYLFSGRGWVREVKVDGIVPFNGIVLRARVYNVDESGLPTGAPIGTSTGIAWYTWQSSNTFVFPGNGIYIEDDFAVSVELLYSDSPFQQFFLKYTGDAEGGGEDLASLAGFSTGYNWTSTNSTFGIDGDFYIMPKVLHDIHSEFEISSPCVETNSTVTFNNLSPMSTDMMFNMAPNYYEWDFGDGSPLSNEMSPSHVYADAGSYTAVLTTYFDGYNGTSCSHTSEMQISVGLDVSTTNPIDASCYGLDDGQITAVPIGGTAPYEYTVNGGTFQTDPTIAGLPAGTHVMYISDALGCTNTVLFDVEQPGELLINFITTTNSSCGNSDGAMTINASGGTGDLEYLITPGDGYQDSGVFSEIPSGGYHIIVQDENGCTTSGAAVVDDIEAPTLSLLSYNNVSCNGGSDGSIIVIGSGGIGLLEYGIDGEDYTDSGAFLEMEAGIYNITVKDASGCETGLVVEIDEPPLLTGLTANLISEVSCNGDSNAQIQVSGVTGGTGNFLYSIGETSQSSTIFSGLSMGEYTVMVEDIAGCTDEISFIIDEPDVLEVSAIVADVSCFGGNDGSISSLVEGGTMSYEYSLDGDDYQFAGNFDGLDAGNYIVYVLDNHDCEAAIEVSITQPGPISSTITPTSATCGGADGGFLVLGAGGSGGPYLYSTDGEEFSTEDAYTGLEAGNYLVVVQDVIGCEEVFPFTINSTTGPTIEDYSSTDISCFGGDDGSIEITDVIGGVGELEYSIDGSPFSAENNFTGLNAGTHTVIVQDGVDCLNSITVVLDEAEEILVTTTFEDDLCTSGGNAMIEVSAGGGIGELDYSLTNGATWQSSNVFTDLFAGTYVVLVQDAAGCEGEAVVTLNEPSPIILSGGWANVTCAGAMDGAIIANSFGGTGETQFSIDGVNYQFNPVFQGLSGGVYILYAKDQNDCLTQVQLTVEEPLELLHSETIYDVSCAGGDDGVIDLSVTGGNPPYFFQWPDGENTEDKFNLSAGTYEVTVTDQNGCSFTDSFIVSEPDSPLVVNSTITNASGPDNADGEIDIVLVGGTAPYSYFWSIGANTQDVSGLLPGDYTVLITDMMGCSVEITFTVMSNVGISDATMLENGLKLYPNPARDQLNIEIQGFDVDRIILVNMLGEIVYEDQPYSSNFALDVSNLSTGMYFIQLYVGENLTTKRIEIIK